MTIMEQHSVLVSNHRNWELSYQDSSLPKSTTSLSLLALLIGTTVIWPIFFFGGAVSLIFSSYSYFEKKWKQDKIIKILQDGNKLKEYAEKRIQCCKKQIEDLKSDAKFRMENLKNPAALQLPIPQKKTFKDYLSRELPETYWKGFPWQKFVTTDFFQKSQIPNNSDESMLQKLEKIRIRVTFLSSQIEFLSNKENNERLVNIRKIAELSFIKNAFERQISKEWIVHSILWLLPSGFFWDLYFNSLINHRLTYERNKHFLFKDLQIYDDLVDAHNKLVAQNPFLVPYIQGTII